MRTILAIIFMTLATQASAWELFGLNGETKLEELIILEERYLVNEQIYEYTVTPPKPVSIVNEYRITYSAEHGICEVHAKAVKDKPYPYGTTIKQNFGELVRDDWQKLQAILSDKYGGMNVIYKGAEPKKYGFSSIMIKMPKSMERPKDAGAVSVWSTKTSMGYLLYDIDNIDCIDGAKRDALDKHSDSLGISSDDF